MISEQVADLREKAIIFENSGCATDGIVKTFRKAADTIEKLSAKLAINSQPPADQWIPCSERLPDESGYYEITVELSGMGKRYTDTEFYSGYEKSWCSKVNIIAWREHLPEPYKGAE